jgi:hypothetical protein
LLQRTHARLSKAKPAAGSAPGFPLGRLDRVTMQLHLALGAEHEQKHA